jgi:hypothetical protein
MILEKAAGKKNKRNFNKKKKKKKKRTCLIMVLCSISHLNLRLIMKSRKINSYTCFLIRQGVKHLGTKRKRATLYVSTLHT